MAGKTAITTSINNRKVKLAKGRREIANAGLSMQKFPALLTMCLMPI
jgi:hypothetical protein